MTVGKNRQREVKHKGGHNNPIQLDWDQMEALMQCKPTLAMTASYFGVSDVTIENKIREKYNLTFGEYRDKAMAFVRATLIQTAIHRAINKSDVLLIFCLKNIAHWADKIESKIEEKPTKELIEQAKELITEYEKSKDETSPH